MDIFENRANSFRVGWPLSLEKYKVTPETLTSAGWFFNADKKHLDACQCYLCEKQLDGWEPEDEAFPEHVSHSGKCPLTRLHELEARKDTFIHSFAVNNGVVNSGTNGIRKRGHAQLFKKLASMGFFYWPLSQSSLDNIVCYRCGESKSGWFQDCSSKVTDEIAESHSNCHREGDQEDAYIKILSNQIVLQEKDKDEDEKDDEKVIKNDEKVIKNDEKVIKNDEKVIKDDEKVIKDDEKVIKDEKVIENVITEINGNAKKRTTRAPPKKRKAISTPDEDDKIEIDKVEFDKKSSDKREFDKVESLKVESLKKEPVKKESGNDECEVVVPMGRRSKRCSPTPMENENAGLLDTSVRRSRRRMTSMSSAADDSNLTNGNQMEILSSLEIVPKPKKIGRKKKITPETTSFEPQEPQESSSTPTTIPSSSLTTTSTTTTTTTIQSTLPNPVVPSVSLPQTRPSAVSLLLSTFHDDNYENLLFPTSSQRRKSEQCMALAQGTRLVPIPVPDSSMTVEAYLRLLASENMNLFRQQCSALRQKLVQDIADMRQKIEAVPVMQQTL